MKIYATRSPALNDNLFYLWQVAFGKRKTFVCLSKLESQLGITPSANAIRQALNDSTRPGDKLATENDQVVFATA